MEFLFPSKLNRQLGIVKLLSWGAGLSKEVKHIYSLNDGHDFGHLRNFRKNIFFSRNFYFLIRKYRLETSFSTLKYLNYLARGINEVSVVGSISV